MFGSDPEVFAVRGGNVVPPYFVLGGDVELQLPHGTVYGDGAALEFTITPSETPKQAATKIYENVEALRGLLPAQYKLSAASAADVSTWIPKLPERFGKRCSLQIFGCNADETIYQNADWERPDPKTTTFRCVGGHVHIGLPDSFMELLSGSLVTKAAYVSLLDNTLGVLSVTLAQDMLSKQRKLLYGRAGTIRTKPYGIEYRVLPAKLLLVYKDVAELLFTVAGEVTDMMLTTEMSDLFTVLTADVFHATQQAINTHDVAQCKAALKYTSDQLLPNSVALKELICMPSLGDEVCSSQ